MLHTLRKPLLSWLGAAAITAAFGWPIVRFLPLYSSIPLMVLLVLAATFEGVFFAVMSVPGSGGLPRPVRVALSTIIFLAFVSPMAIATALAFAATT
jgi:hypothetical protein